MRWVIVALVALVVALSLPFRSPVRAEPPAPRLALVIGNGAFDGTDRLPTATADAGLVAGALAQDGFDVTAMGDVDAETLRKTVTLFVDKVREAGPNATVFVYLSGYGLQFAGGNFVVPVGATIVRQADVPGAAVPLAEVVGPLDALPARGRFYVLDLARPNGFAAGDALPLSTGLMPATPKEGSHYAFNAAPDTVGGREIPPYGLYARALAEMLRTPGLSVEQLFRRVRLRAAEMSGGAVVPWDEGAGLEEMVLLPTAGGQPAPATVEERIISEAAPSELYWAAIARDRLDGYRAFVQTFPDDKQTVRLRDVLAVRLEAMTWAAAVHVDTPAAYWTYMRRFPRGPHYVDVRRRLEAVHAPLEPPPRYDVYPFDGLPAPTADEVAALSRPEAPTNLLEWPQVPPPPSGLLPPPPDAFTVGLPPPPLVPDGVLPAPAALPQVETAAVGRSGRIVQPFVKGRGQVTIEYRPPPAPMVLAAGGATISKTTTTTAANDARTILQTGPDDHVLSRTVTTRAGGTLTTVQTGPAGGIVSKMTTLEETGGRRTTTIVNGANKLVAEVKTDPRGVVVGVRRGDAPHEDETFGLVTPRKDTPRPEGARPATPPPPSPKAPVVAPPGPASSAGPSPKPPTAAKPGALKQPDSKALDPKALDPKTPEPKPAARDAQPQAAPATTVPSTTSAPARVPSAPVPQASHPMPVEPRPAPQTIPAPAAAAPAVAPKSSLPPAPSPVPKVLPSEPPPSPSTAGAKSPDASGLPVPTLRPSKPKPAARPRVAPGKAARPARAPRAAPARGPKRRARH